MMATTLLMLVCGVVAGRFSHVFGVAPILGALLCAACFLPPRQLFFVALGGILVRDLIVGLGPLTLVRLVGITLVAGILLILKVRPSPRPLLTGLLISSPIFHLTLAAGDWWTGTCAVLPKTPQGFLSSIVGSLPYFQRSFVGDMLFTSLFFAAYGMVATVFRIKYGTVLGSR